MSLPSCRNLVSCLGCPLHVHLDMYICTYAGYVYVDVENMTALEIDIFIRFIISISITYSA